MNFKILPQNPADWRRAFLRPLKAYTIGGYLLYVVLGAIPLHLGHMERLVLRLEIAEILGVLYLLSVPLLFLGGFMQRHISGAAEARTTFICAWINALLALYSMMSVSIP